jgi:hypothetical protein
MRETHSREGRGRAVRSDGRTVRSDGRTRLRERVARIGLAPRVSDAMQLKTR